MLPAQPAAQFRYVPPKPVDSDAKTSTFRTNQAANNGDVAGVGISLLMIICTAFIYFSDDEVAPRKDFITNNALEVTNLDI